VSNPACKTLAVSIRRARADELQTCAELYERSGNAAFTWRPKNWFHAAAFHKITKSEEIYVAESRGAILGIMAFYRPQNFIHCLYIDPSAQGFGIGSALIEAADNIAGGPLALKVDEANSRARTFYDRHGFRPDGEIGVDHGIPWLRMTKFG